MRRSLILFAALAVAAPASAGPTARSFDLVTYTAPDGFTVDTSSSDHVAITRVGTKSYCVIGIYAAGNAGADLATSFANEWRDVANKTIDPVDAPATNPAQIGGADALVGGAMSKAGGKPVFALLTVVDAGSRVVSILVLTPSPDDFKIYLPQVQALFASIGVRRVEPAAAPPPADQAPPPPSGDTSGRVTVPPLTRTLKLSELVGEWKHDDSALTSYVSASTGAYAGYESVSYTEKWVVSAKGTITNDFHGVTAGNGGARAVDEKSTGPATISKDNVLDIKWNHGAEQLYVIRGMLVGPELTIVVLNGPYYAPDQIEKRIFTDPNYGWNLNEYFVRKTPKAK
ncbi:MAG TPA: hypothetical protein VL463_05635 [Kofleriaceae bacterium]|nr:hypothetical protein [Kofleriaceae bacterium]